MFRTLIFLFAATIAANAFADSDNEPLTLAEWMDKCPNEKGSIAAQPGARMVAPAVSAVVAVLAPKLVDAAVDHAGAAIKAAADTESRASSASPILERFYTVTNTGELSLAPEVGCLVIVRAGYPRPPNQRSVNILDYDKDRLVLHFEAKLEPLPGLRFFQFAPKYLETGKYELGSFWNSERDISVSIAMRPISSPEPFASWTFQWHNLSPNTKLENGELRLKSSTSVPLPYPADLGEANSAKAIQAARVAPYLVAMDVIDKVKAPPALPRRPADLNESNVTGPLTAYCTELDAVNQRVPQAAKLTDQRCFVALNAAEETLSENLALAYKSQSSQDWAKKLCPTYDGDEKCDLPWAEGLERKRFGTFVSSSVVTESRPANKFGTALASAITSSSNDIKKVFKENLLPSERKEAEERTSGQAREARRGLLLADLEVMASEVTLSLAQSASPPDRAAIVKAQIDLAKKKITANDAYRKAGRDVPFPEFD